MGGRAELRPGSSPVAPCCQLSRPGARRRVRTDPFACRPRSVPPLGRETPGGTRAAAPEVGTLELEEQRDFFPATGRTYGTLQTPLRSLHPGSGGHGVRRERGRAEARDWGGHPPGANPGAPGASAQSSRSRGRSGAGLQESRGPGPGMPATPRARPRVHSCPVLDLAQDMPGRARAVPGPGWTRPARNKGCRARPPAAAEANKRPGSEKGRKKERREVGGRGGARPPAPAPPQAPAPAPPASPGSPAFPSRPHHSALGSARAAPGLIPDPTLGQRAPSGGGAEPAFPGLGPAKHPQRIRNFWNSCLDPELCSRRRPSVCALARQACPF